MGDDENRTGTETVLQRAGPIGDETSDSRPKSNWTAIGYFSPETTDTVYFYVRANGKDIYDSAKNVEWADTKLIVVEYNPPSE